MGLRQLPRRGQLQVGDDHHFRVRFEGGREQEPQTRQLLFGLGSPGNVAFTPVSLVHHNRLGNELSAIALVDTCFTAGVDLTLVVVVDAGTWSHTFVVGDVHARESTFEFKLQGLMLPFLVFSSASLAWWYSRSCSSNTAVVF
jgi:hypothetical protein